MNGRIAVIDIGSNSVRYMIAERTGESVRSLHKELLTTRLAEGQDADMRLQEEPMRRSADAVRFFAALAQKSGIPAVAYATSALREASNRTAFIERISDAVPLAILTGAEEGRMAYLGATRGTGTLLDIGGGSFQIVTDTTAFSAPIGCVRFRDRMPEGTPEELYAALEPWADAYLREPAPISSPVVGVGGTITTLGALLLKQTSYDGASLENACITHKQLLLLLDTLYAMGEKRKKHPLLTKRHNVILQGGTILRYLLERLSIEAVIPCDRDGMEGFAEAVFSGKISVK